MGRLAPWVKFSYEWQDIYQERQKRSQFDPQSQRNSLSPPFTSENEGNSSWLRFVFSSIGVKHRERTLSSQNQSLLFRLPVELRLVIWKEVFEGDDITILRKVNKLGHSRLPRDMNYLNAAEKSTRSKDRKRYKDREVLAGENLLPLLQSCRLIYLEALEVLYSERVFVFDRMESFYRFLHAVPPEALNYIQHIQLDWVGFAFWRRICGPAVDRTEATLSWHDICNTISGMENLKDIRIDPKSPRLFDNEDCFSDAVDIIRPLGECETLSKVQLQFRCTDAKKTWKYLQDLLDAPNKQTSFTDVKEVGLLFQKLLDTHGHQYCHLSWNRGDIRLAPQFDD